MRCVSVFVWQQDEGLIPKLDIKVVYPIRLFEYTIKIIGGQRLKLSSATVWLLFVTQHDCSVITQKRKENLQLDHQTAAKLVLWAQPIMCTPLWTHRNMQPGSSSGGLSLVMLTSHTLSQTIHTHSFHFRFSASLISCFVTAHYYFFNFNNNPQLPLLLPLPPLSTPTSFSLCVIHLSPFLLSPINGPSVTWRYSSEINLSLCYNKTFKAQ